MNNHDCYRWVWNISDMDMSDAEYSWIRECEDEESDFEEQMRLLEQDAADDAEVI